MPDARGDSSTTSRKRLTDVVLNDAAQACALIDRKYGEQIVRLFDASEHGRALRDAGFGDDLACARP